MIVGVTLAEKEERAKDRVKQKALLRYDPEKWAKANAEIRDEEYLEVEYQSLKTIQPTKGKHRFAQCQMLYEDVHSFLKERKWAPAQPDTEVGGITWIELFILFRYHREQKPKGTAPKKPSCFQTS